jgi:hypothetical protein
MSYAKAENESKFLQKLSEIMHNYHLGKQCPKILDCCIFVQAVSVKSCLNLLAVKLLHREKRGKALLTLLLFLYFY